MHRLSKKTVAALAVAASAGVVGLTGAATASASTPVDPPADTTAGTAADTAAPVVPPADTTVLPVEPGAPASGTITVSGTGSVTVDPDTAVVNLGVQVTAETGEAAMEQVSSGVTDLTAALVAAGIAEEDIQTSGLSLWSTFGDDGATVTGYQASINVDVTVRDIDAVGSAIDTAQQAAGPGFTVGGVTFSFADPETVLEEARVEAFANAQTIAGQYAAAAGVNLGSVESIVDTPLGIPVNFGRVGAMEDAAAGVPISPGTLDLQVQVTVTFTIA
ncbi:SIMPL domain-containing protein [Desertimonas flava]|uniref:SIMPL domain-containing protein n=1 Tax=Desertimonas flava TaxID=2064846 RepID=UPI0013C47E47|nr:SIMPL domain-containing protein [Desertimonas flava]